MEVPFDVLDHIFSFLKFDLKSLFLCLEALPEFSQIIEKHALYHIILHTGATDFVYSVDPSDLLKDLLDMSSTIQNYVRVVEIEFIYLHDKSKLLSYLDKIALILPKLCLLERLILSTRYHGNDIELLELPESFRNAVEDCISLPTLHELHVGHIDFPHFILNNHTNINLFSLSGSRIRNFQDTIYPELRSLAVDRIEDEMLFTTWAKQYIPNLQSLKYDYSNNPTILGLLECCSHSLENLDIGLRYQNSQSYATIHDLNSVLLPSPRQMSLDLSSLPHLQHLIIRTKVHYEDDLYLGIDEQLSFLPALVEILKTASSLQHLNIDIYVQCDGKYFFDDIDFSPLATLVEISASFRRIDLHVHSMDYCDARTQIVPLFGRARYKGLMKLVEQDVLVIHPEPAPTFFGMFGKSTTIQHPRLSKTNWLK